MKLALISVALFFLLLIPSCCPDCISESEYDAVLKERDDTSEKLKTSQTEFENVTEQLKNTNDQLDQVEAELDSITEELTSTKDDLDKANTDLINIETDLTTTKIKLTSCQTDLQEAQEYTITDVRGCTNSKAENYDPEATVDDDSCVILGCTDPLATNYERDANKDDGSCITPIYGCTNPGAENFNPLATKEDGTCDYGPTPPPTSCQGATAICKDGWCSDSASCQGTCSGHGGVDEWLSRGLAMGCGS